MSSLNRVQLIGNLGKEPEIKQAGGKNLAVLSVATTDNWKDKSSGELKSKTEWHKVVVFNTILADKVAKDASKGSKVYVEGSLVTRKWTDQNGQDKYITEINVQGYEHKLIIFDGKEVLAKSTSSTGYGSMKDTFDDEIPF